MAAKFEYTLYYPILVVFAGGASFFGGENTIEIVVYVTKVEWHQ